MGREEHLISTAELAERLGDRHVRVVDLRWDLADRDAGRQAYLAGHLPGAVYLDWLRDLSDSEDPVEGQLARPDQFAQVMGQAGIDNQTLVVAYDDNRIFMASRLAWALRHYGHDRSRVLDGGWPKWVSEGRPLETGKGVVEPALFTTRESGETRVELDEMLNLVKGGETLILDCRMEETWAASGEHIPGARRLPSPSLVRNDGTFRSPAEIESLASAQGATPKQPVVLYCGGGVSASAGFLALRQAGYEQVRVYDGSWSEWGARPDTPKASHRSGKEPM